jgi:hypothetical protein
MSASARVARGRAQGLVCLETSQPQVETVAGNSERRRFGRLRRTVLTAGRLMVDTWRGSRAQWWMVTLTYRPEDDWAPRQITVCTERFRKWCKRNKFRCSYLWVLETTAAGRPHYHLLVQLPQRVSLPHFDSQGWWIHGLTQTERAIRPVGYVAKYASKAGSYLQQFIGARAYGVCGLLPRDRAVLSFWRSPRWVRAAFGFCHASGSLPETEVSQPVRKVRGGWLWHQTGELKQSPWVARFIAGSLFFYPRDQIEFAHSGVSV